MRITKHIIFRIAFFLFTTLLLVKAYGQSIDHRLILEEKLINAEGHTQIDLLIELGWEYAFEYPDKAFEYGEKAYKQAIDTDYLDGEIASLYLLGQLNAMQHQIEESIRYYARLIILCRGSTHFYDTHLNALHEISTLLQEKGNWEKTRNYLAEGLQLSKSKNDLVQVAAFSHELGNAELATKNPTKALEYFKASYPMFEEQGKQRFQAITLENIGMAFQQIQQFDSTQHYFEKAFKKYSQINNHESASFILKYRAHAYLLEGVLDSVLFYGQKSLEMAEQSRALVGCYEAHQVLYQAYRQKNDLRQALYHLEQYSLLRDSAMDFFQSAKITDIENQHQAENQAREIELLKQQQESNTTRLRLQGFIIAFVLVFALVLSVLSWILFRENRRKREMNRLLTLKHQEALEKQQEITKQNSLLIKQRDEIREKNEHLKQLDAQKNHLIGVVAHDLQTPMNKIIGFSQLIRMSGSLNEEQDDMLERMDQVVKDGKEMIRKVLDIHTLEESENTIRSEKIELQPFLQSVIASHTPHAANKDIHISLENKANGLSVHVDKIHLTRVMDNLVSNAIKFSPFHKEVKVVLEEKKDTAQIRVADQGPGISKEERARLFNKFQKLSNRPTAGEASTGIGLSITKGLVEAMNGRIQVSSQIGRGSEFSINLPKNGVSAHLPTN